MQEEESTRRGMADEMYKWQRFMSKILKFVNKYKPNILASRDFLFTLVRFVS